MTLSKMVRIRNRGTMETTERNILTSLNLPDRHLPEYER
jgi:hypothetical protein